MHQFSNFCTNCTFILYEMYSQDLKKDGQLFATHFSLTLFLTNLCWVTSFSYVNRFLAETVGHFEIQEASLWQSERFINRIFITVRKGQIISKWFFGVFDFLQKTNENKSIWSFEPWKMNKGIQLYYYDTSNRLVFVRFLEEIEDTKNPFQNYLTFTNWPENQWHK